MEVRIIRLALIAAGCAVVWGCGDGNDYGAPTIPTIGNPSAAPATPMKSPQGMRVETTGDCERSCANLSWQPVTDPSVVGYKLYFGRASREYAPPLQVGPSPRYSLQGLQPHTSYYLAVTAQYDGGEESGFSNEVIVTTTPSNSRHVTLSWDPVTGDPSIEGYKLYFGRTSGKYAPPIDVGASPSYKLFGLQPQTIYYFAITAYNSAGESGYSNEASFMTQ
ncbi:MAG: fibronectin type III domain-containing protein [Nitrospiraceae bacterium]